MPEKRNPRYPRPDMVEWGALTASPDPTTCANCGRTTRVERYVADGSVISWSHGLIQYWCRRCIIVAQISYAQDAAGRLPDLQAELVKETEAAMVEALLEDAAEVEDAADP